MKKLLYLITPTLIYFSLIGNVGAKNVLTAWYAFGLGVSVLVAGLAFLLGVINVLMPEETNKPDSEEKTKDFYDQLRKLKKMRVIDWVGLVYAVVFAYMGWWLIFSLDALGTVLLKLTACMIADEEK